MESNPGVIPGWLIAGGKTRDLGLTRTSGFDLTDIVALPDGATIVLEPHFSMFPGCPLYTSDPAHRPLRVVFPTSTPSPT